MNDKFIFEIKQYIPILHEAFTEEDYIKRKTPIKEIIIKKKKKSSNMLKNIFKCYKCNQISQNLQLRQISSLKRCTDELIETHFLCMKCI